MLLDNNSFPDIVDAILRASDFASLLTWRMVSGYHRSVTDAIIFAHVHVYERDPHVGDLGLGWGVCTGGRRWAYWHWERVDPSPIPSLLPLPFKHTRVLDLSWQGPRGDSVSATPIPSSILREFDPETVRLVAYRGMYPSLEYVWPKARLISFADVSTTRRRGAPDVRVPGPSSTTSTVLHLKYDSRRDAFFRMLAIGYTFPVFKPTHNVTVIVSPDRPGPESLLERRQTVVQILKRLGYWIRYGNEEEWSAGVRDEEYRITLVVDGVHDLEELKDEPRATALRADIPDGCADMVPSMPVTFMTHADFQDSVGRDEAALHYHWPTPPSGRIATFALWAE